MTMTKQKQKRKRHASCRFTPELGEKICAALAAGRSILAMARTEGMPPESTIRRWGRISRWSSEEFVAEFARAREDNADHHFDRMQEIEVRLEQQDIDPHAARVLLDSMKWRLAKQLPRSYGDRTALEVSGRVERPLSDAAPEWLQEKIRKAAQSAPTEQQEENSVETPKTMH